MWVEYIVHWCDYCLALHPRPVKTGVVGVVVHMVVSIVVGVDP